MTSYRSLKTVEVDPNKLYKITNRNGYSYLFKPFSNDLLVFLDDTVTLVESGSGQIQEHVAQAQPTNSETEQLRRQNNDLLFANNKYLERARRAENALRSILNSSDSQMRDGNYARELAEGVLNAVFNS